MAMFKEKLVLKGRIYLQKPNRIAWHVDSPVRYSVLITDKLIRQWDEDTNKVQEISLAKNPDLSERAEPADRLVLRRIRLAARDQRGPHRAEQTPSCSNSLPWKRTSPERSSRASRSRSGRTRNTCKQIRIREVNGDVTTINFINTLLNAPLDSSSFEVKG